MSKEIEKLIKLQGIINKNRYHLHVDTDLDKKYRWVLFLKLPDVENYFSSNNPSILNSTVDSIDYLINYLEKHDGLNGVWY